MGKIHTRLKRKFGLTSSFGHMRFFSGGSTRKNGPKTFKTEEKAKEYIKLKALKGYEILPTGKKVKIVLKE